MPRRIRGLPRIRPRNLAQSRDLFGQKSVPTIEEIRREQPASASHECATIQHASTLTERPPRSRIAQCISLHGAMRFANCALRVGGIAELARDGVLVGPFASLSSSPAKAGDPVTRRLSVITGCPAFAGHDRRRDSNGITLSCKEPLAANISTKPKTSRR
jgi:hypothetical protein